MDNEETYRERLQQDPGDECFVEYADYLRVHRRYLEGIGVCLAGLSANPGLRRGRLVLARVFYDAGYLPFAAREVEELSRLAPANPAIKRLLEVMVQDMPSEERGKEAEGNVEADSTVAEADFDFDDLGE